MFRGKEGFTLVELLIVLAVIAALLATVTPVAINAVKKAKATQVAANLRNIKSAVEQCVTVEATTESTCNSLDDLYEEHYLNKEVDDNYSLSLSAPDENGNIEGAVCYTGGDVDQNRVHGIYEEAEASGDDICVEIRLAKFW